VKALRRTSQFKVDLRCQKKRGKDLDKLKRVIEDLISGRTLSRDYRDHQLIGKYRGTRECHIEPDWLLIYEKTSDEIILIRTGSHTDLFQ